MGAGKSNKEWCEPRAHGHGDVNGFAASLSGNKITMKLTQEIEAELEKKRQLQQGVHSDRVHVHNCLPSSASRPVLLLTNAMVPKSASRLAPTPGIVSPPSRTRASVGAGQRRLLDGRFWGACWQGRG